MGKARMMMTSIVMTRIMMIMMVIVLKVPFPPRSRNSVVISLVRNYQAMPIAISFLKAV